MKPYNIIEQLSKNNAVFEGLLRGASKKEHLWRVKPLSWCLLEIVCHLHDEEREDFRARTKQVLEDPRRPLMPFDPIASLQDRNYIKKNYDDMLYRFLNEREQSIDWLRSLVDPNWDNAFKHPQRGTMTANLFLASWLAHDYLHIRQILRIKFHYLNQTTDESLSYAGDW